MSSQKIVLKHSLVEDRVPDSSIMEYGELYVNGASGTGKSFISTKKSGNAGVARFMEKDYNDAKYATKDVVNAINSSYISAAVMDTAATSPSVTNHILTIPTITSGTVIDMLGELSGNATIASKVGNVVTLKASVVESQGEISNGSQSDIVLGAIASTSNASDLNATYQSTSYDVQSIINAIDTRLTSLESTDAVNVIVCDNQQNQIPNGATYVTGTTRITGRMAAGTTTAGNIYLVRSGTTYHQWVTTKNNNTYSWVDLGTTSIDLSGYAKNITRNGKTYTTVGDTISLDDALTNIIGESEVSNGDSNYVSVAAALGSASNGDKSVTLSSKVKIQAISTATDAANGLATSKDVKDYVEDCKTIIRSWTEADII